MAAGVAFPRNVNEVAALVANAASVLAVGAQSSLTGGATPRGDLVLSTRALTNTGAPVNDRVRVAAGVPLKTLQQMLAARGLYYPPVPTYDGAFVGGTAATNAAGAATFKYGTTRDWVDGLTVVLANGDILELARGEVVADGRSFELESAGGDVTRFAAPGYSMPDVPKLSAGYFARDGMDLVDLFIGSEGTLGVIVDATLRVIARPHACSILIECANQAQALDVTTRLRAAAHAGRLDVAAIEYMDANSLACIRDDAFAVAGIARPREARELLLAQIEVGPDEESALEALLELLGTAGVTADPLVALPGDDAGAARLFQLREAVPAGVNARIGAAAARVPGVQKTAGDMIVPFDRLGDSLTLYRREFEKRGLGFAVWGHVSDGNLHPNVIAQSLADVEAGREALRAIAEAVIAMGGAPLAEHGVGRSALKQALLARLYGEEGIAEMRAVKRALDPMFRLAPGVLFSITEG